MGKNKKSSKQNKLTRIITELPSGSAEYQRFVEDIKSQIHATSIKTALSVNRELILLYLEMGRKIMERQKEHNWGQSIVEKLSKDLRLEFPDIKGFSPRNLWDMRRLYRNFPLRKAVKNG